MQRYFFCFHGQPFEGKDLFSREYVCQVSIDAYSPHNAAKKMMSLLTHAKVQCQVWATLEDIDCEYCGTLLSVGNGYIFKLL